MNNQESNSKNLTANKTSARLKGPSRQKILGFGLLLVLLCGILAYQLVNDNKNDTTNQAQYSYKNTQTVVISEAPTGNGMSFLRPEKYVQVGGPSGNKKEFVLLQKVDGSETYTDFGNQLGRVEAFNEQTGPKSTSSEQIKNGLNSLDGDAYNLAQKSVEFTIKNLYKASTVDNISKAKAFTNQNITKDAWQFDFTTKGESGTPNQTGTAVFAIGKNGLYYFVVSADSQSWQSNQSFFETLTGSIQIDL